MDVRVGDELVMKKAHPCGENRFEVLRSGIDFRLRCKKCGREVLVVEPFAFLVVEFRTRLADTVERELLNQFVHRKHLLVAGVVPAQ